MQVTRRIRLLVIPLAFVCFRALAVPRSSRPCDQPVDRHILFCGGSPGFLRCQGSCGRLIHLPIRDAGIGCADFDTFYCRCEPGCGHVDETHECARCLQGERAQRSCREDVPRRQNCIAPPHMRRVPHTTDGLACDEGWANVDLRMSNGCEIDISRVESCGTPPQVCLVRNGEPRCALGSDHEYHCVIASCTRGFGNCTDEEGCETDTAHSVRHCGGCRDTAPVPAPHSTLTCQNGELGHECEPGFKDCDGNYSTTGCETNTIQDNANCGGCGNVCGTDNAIATCAGGRCQLRCLQDFLDCDTLNSNGCETNIRTDSLNCGSCGRHCSDGQRCSDGACVCFDPTQRICGGTCVDTQTDHQNCGGCGTQCLPGESCANGCCLPRFLRCGGSCAHVSSDRSNCGGCGIQCTNGQLCDGGRCVNVPAPTAPPPAPGRPATPPTENPAPTSPPTDLSSAALTFRRVKAPDPRGRRPSAYPATSSEASSLDPRDRIR